jgi:hypothetical protein
MDYRKTTTALMIMADDDDRKKEYHHRHKRIREKRFEGSKLLDILDQIESYLKRIKET